MGGQSLKQGRARPLDERVDALEAVAVTAVRIRHLADARRRAELVEEQPDSSAVHRAQERSNVREVLSVHREDLIEGVEVVYPKVPGALRGQVNAAAARHRLRHCVGRFAHMPAPCAGGRDLEARCQTRLVDQGAKDPLRDRRAADVAEAYKLDPQRRRHSFFQPPRA